MLQKRSAFSFGANGPVTSQPLQYAQRDIEHLKRALRNPATCGFDRVESIVADDAHIVLAQLERFTGACERSELLVVHFSGHGFRPNGQLHLLCNNTNTEYEFNATSINIFQVRNILEGCKAKHKILILDCCYAGNALKKSEEKLPELEALKGSVNITIAACPPLMTTQELESLEIYGVKGAGFLSWAIARACDEQFGQAAREGALSLQDILKWLSDERNKVNQTLPLEKHIPMPRILDERDLVGDNEIWFTTHTRDHSFTDAIEEIRRHEELAINKHESFLRQYCSGAEVNDLSREKVLEYAKKQGDFDRLHTESIIKLCKQLGLASGSGVPRHAAVLAFHPLPNRYIHSALIRVTLRTLNDEIYSPDDIKGPLDEQVEKAIQWLIINLRTISENAGAGKRIDRCEIPERALRELVVNAVLHRDYEEKASVHIKITPKQIIFTNPGRLNSAIANREQPFSYQESHPVNPFLLDVLIAQRWAEGRSRGFEIVTKEFRTYGMKLPEIRNLPGNLVQVVIQRPESNIISQLSLSPDQLAGHRVVTIGGGSGTFSLLSYLKKYPMSITAIVTMSSSGGSSRRLMDEFRRQLPLGSLRMSLVALAKNGALWREVFMHRFEQTDENGNRQTGVGGHSLGNLILKGLQDISHGNLLLAIEDAQELLNTAGNVIPVTLAQTTICADLEDSSVLCDETEIDTRGQKHPETLSPIKRLRLHPEDAPGCPQAIRAIRRADTIIIGPGDLYTSLLPNLLVPDIAQAVRESDAEKVYICNLMTKHGETDGYKASDFVNTIHTYLGTRVDRIVINEGTFPTDVLKTYHEEQSQPVEVDRPRLERLVPSVVIGPFNLNGDSLARHDPERLAYTIFTTDKRSREKGKHS